MKAESTIKKELRDLRRMINAEDTDNLTKRIAWEIEQAIRWAREDVRDWPRPIESAVGAALLIRQEIKSGDIRP